VPLLPLGGLNAKGPDVALLHNNEPLQNYRKALSCLYSFSLRFRISQVRITLNCNYGTHELDTRELHGTYNRPEECLDCLRSHNILHRGASIDATIQTVALKNRSDVYPGFQFARLG
jgi:hypothetical protein